MNKLVVGGCTVSLSNTAMLWVLGVAVAGDCTQHDKICRLEQLVQEGGIESAGQKLLGEETKTKKPATVCAPQFYPLLDQLNRMIRIGSIQGVDAHDRYYRLVVTFCK